MREKSQKDKCVNFSGRIVVFNNGEMALTRCIVLIFLSVLAILRSVSPRKSKLMELNIVHFNDFHAHFEEISPSGGECSEGETCIGGFARLYTAIRQACEAEPDSIVLNGGDTFQGSLWYNLLKWNATYYFMNMLPLDAHVLGNHDFDDGPDGLAPYLERLKAPMLGANVNTSLEPSLEPYIKNHVVIKRRGKKIGIIGLLLQEFTAPKRKVIMEDELEAVNREAAILKKKGVHIIILLSHVGFDTDISLAERMSPEVDIIVGGHSHSLLYTGKTPNGDVAESNYPHLVKRSDGKTIPIVQASCYTRYLGVVKFFIDSEGNMKRWEGQPVFLGSSIVQDPRILELMEPWRAIVDAIGNELLGRSLVTLNRSWCYKGECNMGSWVCDGFLHETIPRATGTRWNDAHVCITNAGGLRVPIAPGNVTTRGLLMSIPFQDAVEVYDLRGKYLLETLEASVAQHKTGEEFNSKGMVQIGGMRNIYNASAPANSRVVSVLVRCIDCDIPRYEPLDVDKTYRVVTQDYIGSGRSGFKMISENRDNVEKLQFLDYQMLQNYLKRERIIIQGIDGRIQIVY